VSQIQEDNDDDGDKEGKSKTTIVSEFLLSSKEDAPMTIAVNKVRRSLLIPY
jgi:hypothetical protein